MIIATLGFIASIIASLTWEGAVFFNNSIVEYERNTNFTTLGDGIDNAKIKYLRYVYTTPLIVIERTSCSEPRFLPLKVVAFSVLMPETEP